MIPNVRTQTNNSCSNNISFKAIPLGQYKNAKNAVTTVYQLEKSDLPFIDKFCKNIGEYWKSHNITDTSVQDIMKDSFNSAKDILSSKDKLLDDTKILVGVRDNELHGILIGNIPKHSKNKNIHYSSRKNHSKNERELDWFVTWGSKGVGKSLISEFFKTMKEHSFKKLFVRSEIPELSPAQSIYERFGFKQITKRDDWAKKTNNINLIDENVELEHCDIIPMVISRKQMNKTAESISKQCNRTDLLRFSTPIENIVE